jgi:hypothetical protein
MPEPTGTALAHRIPVLSILSTERGFEVDDRIDVRHAGAKLSNPPGGCIAEGTPTGLIAAEPYIVCPYRWYTPLYVVTKANFSALALNHKMSIVVARREKISHFVPTDPDLLRPALRIPAYGHSVLALLLLQPRSLLISRDVWLSHLQLHVV